jgi:LuxR family maltose regulon positive regulatory protein
LQHMPAHVHLILTTRADPPLPLERLRGRQQLAEIRSADLSFTTEEAEQLLQQILGEVATDEIAALLEESTEGWAVGLQLAAISLRGRSNPTEFARKIAQSGPRLVMDYLVAEVLEGQSEAMRIYLLQTSLLDRFCAPLCDAIQGEARQELTGEDFLRAVRRSNLFFVPLDAEGTWFRYHHLFQYLMRNRLHQASTAAEIRDMHARASAWFAGQGLFDEAIVHAVKAGDVEGAATLVEDQVHPCLDHEDWRQVECWLRLLPEEALSRPRLLVAQAWLGYVRYQFSSIATLLGSGRVWAQTDRGQLCAAGQSGCSAPLAGTQQHTLRNGRPVVTESCSRDAPADDPP